MHLSPFIPDRSKLLPVAIFFFIVTRPAMACGTCVYALWEMALPPAWLWMAGLLGWHLSFTYVNVKNGGQLPNIPSFLATSGGLILLTLIGMAALGPIAFLVLLFHPGQLLFKLLFGKLGNLDEQSIIGIKRNAKAGLLLLAILLAISFTVKSQRTKAEWLLKWERTSPGVVFLGKLAKGAETLSKEELRQLESQGSPGLVCKISGRLAELREPAYDVPLLIRVLEKTDLQREDRERLWQALKTLTGLVLPIEATAQDWKAAWQAQSNTKSASPTSQTPVQAR